MLNVLGACFILFVQYSSAYIAYQVYPVWYVSVIVGTAGLFLGIVIAGCLLLLMERVRSFCTEFCNTLIEQSLIFLVNLLVLDMTNLIPSQFVDACSSFQLIMSSTIGCGGKNDTEN